MRCIRLLYICLFALLMLGCSTPLVPTAELPVPSRQVQSDADIVGQLRLHWKTLGTPGISEQERAQALHDYNKALLVLVKRVRHDALKSHRLESYSEFEMPAHKDARRLHFLGLHDDIIPAAEVKLVSLQDRYILPGIGVPLVGIIPADKAEQSTEDMYNITSRGMVSVLTAVMEFSADGKPHLKVIPIRRQQHFAVGKLKYPLAADWSAALEVYWDLTRVREDRMLGLLRPQELRSTTGLSSIQAYNPNKIPVILTHGLMSSAGTFDNLVNRLYADPEIRNNYQFWYFNYPTGVAWTVSARAYRTAIQKLRDQVDPSHSNPNWDRMVVIGHSMGGLITHYSQCVEPWNLLLASDIPKDKLEPLLKKKYVDTPMPDPALESMRGDYFFRPVEAGLVIYLATPHRGAPVAKYRLVTALTKFVTLPQTLVKEAYNIATLQQDIFLLNPQNAYLWFTSVNQLKPDSYSISGLHGLKVRNVPTHSIIGDRGKGDSPKSSDGVVPCWSSHMPWGTETIVPSEHSVQDCMETANDLKRVLGDYVAKKPAVKVAAPRKLLAPHRSTGQQNRHDSASQI
jgi:pimeloyl-ACP methyl ester carboxylesterase